MFEQDFIMRQVEDMTRFLSLLIFGKSSSSEEVDLEEYYGSGEHSLRNTLQQMIDEGNINRAEDLLFEAIEREPSKGNFAVALAFYKTLSELEDEELEAHDFSRQEIFEGLDAIKAYYLPN